MIPVISQSKDVDSAAICALYADAFPEEDLVPLVRQLLGGDAPGLSMITRNGEEVIAHVFFTLCHVQGDSNKLALLAPLAVAPSCQRQGAGRAVVDAGTGLLDAEGVALILVLGDPAYYSRLGFTAESGVEPPYQLPDVWAGAWQSRATTKGPVNLRGKLALPDVWMKRELWLP